MNEPRCRGASTVDLHSLWCCASGVTQHDWNVTFRSRLREPTETDAPPTKVQPDVGFQSCNPAEKKVCNELFAAATKELLAKHDTRRHGPFHVLLLDTPAANTLHHIQPLGLPKSSIHIPQMNPHEYDQMKATLDDQATLYPAVSTQVLAESKLVFGSMNLDFYACFYGNDKCQPEADLHIVFEQRKLLPYSHLACTFSKRSGCARKAHFKYEGFADALSCITKLARQNGYALAFHTLRFYGTVYFMAFTFEPFPVSVPVPLSFRGGGLARIVYEATLDPLASLDEHYDELTELYLSPQMWHRIATATSALLY